MKDDIHHSFKELFEAKQPELLPFNQILDKTKGAGESTTFISIPIKRNARKLPSKANKMNALKELLNPGVDSDNCSNQLNYSFLNFEKALMPHILLTASNDSSKTIKILLEHEQQLKLDDYYVDLPSIGTTSSASPKFDEKLVLSHFPSDSQWYTMNQLRIHAGCPERSMAGVEKLAKYYAQLQYLESKFAFDTGKVRIGFVWYESWFEEQSGIVHLT
jgi:hypothetical protein